MEPTSVEAALLLVFDLAGTFVFALSGAMVGVRRRLDLFGVLVLACVSANSGGVLRDVMIGSVPPAVLRDGRFLAASLLAGLLAFLWHPHVGRIQRPVLVLDAAGLGLFAVTGTLTALAARLDPFAAVILGMLTGIGGGIVRDVLVARVPTVLHAELYAVAALAGACVVALGVAAGISPVVGGGLGAGLCFTLRLLAITRGWGLPVAHMADLLDDTGPPHRR